MKGLSNAWEYEVSLICRWFWISRANVLTSLKLPSVWDTCPITTKNIHALRIGQKGTDLRISPCITRVPILSKSNTEGSVYRLTPDNCEVEKSMKRQDKPGILSMFTRRNGHWNASQFIFSTKSQSSPKSHLSCFCNLKVVLLYNQQHRIIWLTSLIFVKMASLKG